MGTYKVKYNAYDDQDFQLDVEHAPVDLTLIMPHYRALHQPVGHKMTMAIRNRSGSTKLKVVGSSSPPRMTLDFLLLFYFDLVSEHAVVEILSRGLL